MKIRVFGEQCLESSLLKKGVDTGDIRNDVYLSSWRQQESRQLFLRQCTKHKKVMKRHFFGMALLKVWLEILKCFSKCNLFFGCGHFSTKSYHNPISRCLLNRNDKDDLFYCFLLNVERPLKWENICKRKSLLKLLPIS